MNYFSKIQWLQDFVNSCLTTHRTQNLQTIVIVIRTVAKKHHFEVEKIPSNFCLSHSMIFICLCRKNICRRLMSSETFLTTRSRFFCLTTVHGC